MKGFAVPFKKAELVKTYLLEHHLYDKTYLLAKKKDRIIFPITQEGKLLHIFPFGKIVVTRFLPLQKKQSFKEALAALLSPLEQEHIISGFDVVGDIAIVEVPLELKKKERKIARIILITHPHIKTVVKKATIHYGKYRTRGLSYLAGKRTLETIHRENGVCVKLDASKVYFSPRLAEERKRIAALVNPGEKVLVLFSGVGIYPLVLARNSEASLVYGIELNPHAHNYAMKNKLLNNLENITFLKGDAMKVINKLSLIFDRIIMPLPKNAADFLGGALTVAKKGTMIHFYDFFAEEDIPKAAKEKIKMLCKKHHVQCKILDVVKCGQYAPYVSRVCVDFQIT